MPVSCSLPIFRDQFYIGEERGRIDDNTIVSLSFAVVGCQYFERSYFHAISHSSVLILSIPWVALQYGHHTLNWCTLGRYCTSEENLTIDHVYAASRGGGWTWENLVSFLTRGDAKNVFST
jgi:hypothetical protein